MVSVVDFRYQQIPDLFLSFSDKIIMHHKIFFNVLALPTQSKQTVFKQDNLNN
jgi:hypothetical protein